MSYGRPPPDVDGLTSLKVDNLTYRTSPETLRRVFEKYGRVGDVYIPRDRYSNKIQGFAFVRFHDKRDAEDAMDAMDGAMLDGRELRVQMAHADQLTSLKVDNMTYRTSPETLRRLFEKYGRVGDVYIPRDSYTKESQGFAFVRFYNKRDAEDAMDAMDGAVLDGRELRVQMAHGGRRGGQARRYGGPVRGHRSRSRRRENITSSCSSFPDDNAAGPSRLAWNDDTFQFSDHLSHTPKWQKQMVLDEGPDQLHDTDIALVVLEAENDLLREENEKLKKQLEKQKQTLFLQSHSFQS